MKPISLKQLFLKILERKDEDTMWSAFRTLTSGKTNTFIVLKELEDRIIYVCKKDDEYVFIMLDHSMCGKGEIANEDVWNDELYPTYNTSTLRRISPVYELYSYMSAFGQHSNLPISKFIGLLLSDSNIVNSKDMSDGWRNLHVFVKDRLQSVKINMQRLVSDDDLPSSDIVSFRDTIQANTPLYDVEKYYSIFKEEYDDEILETDYDSLPKRVDVAAWVEDDPDFYEVLPGGKKVLSIPKVEVYSRESNPYHTLMNLIGLTEVKKKIRQFDALASYNVLMSNLTLSTQNLNLHALFVGGVGVGKTTVARLYSSLLYHLGLLSIGQVVIADRSTFVDKYWGAAEHTVSKVLKLAQGGVLFIDEAYLMASGDEKDPGRIVIQMLLNVLADQTNRDIAIVFAGYPDKMQELLSINPGLASRFPNIYSFCEFTIPELTSIAKVCFDRVGYKLTDETVKKLEENIKVAYDCRKTDTWGNAREMQNLYEATILRHAERCMAEGVTSKDVEILITITPEDIATPNHNTPPKPHSPKIGFK